MGNHLLGRGSRYLAQHAENPVDWYPWSEEPFRRSAEEHRPVLVSIGYSSCHWCHVMAHESFEDPETAKLLNDRFLAIKIDKEELPDVDSFYMEFLTRTSGRGGWPLNVFVNADRSPFFGMTYLPREHFQETLRRVADAYDADPSLDGGRLDRVFSVGSIAPERVKAIIGAIEIAREAFHPGPRFPQGLYLSFALKRGADELVAEQLEDLISKGLFDHVEGGWFRYSVDGDYRIPHFEKMLYDQAALLMLCAEAFDLNPPLCTYAIGKTLDWLEAHMRLPNGLYGSATDADTSEGEGTYYTIEETADPELRSLLRLDSCGSHEGRLLPWLAFDRYQAAGDRARELIARLAAQRRDRIAPELDRKAVVSWNCFLGVALLRCAERTDRDRLRSVAAALGRSLAPFAADSLPHVIYGEAALPTEGYLEDYASYLLFRIGLARHEQEPLPVTLIPDIRRRFLRGGYLFHASDPRFENLGLWQDTPVPAGGSLLLTALLENNQEDLWGLDRLAIAEIAAENPRFFGLWCSAFDRARSRADRTAR